MKTLPLRVLRRFKHIALLLLLLFTGYLTAGRLLMPLVATQSETIESNLSALMGVPVSIADIRGAWFRFSPSIAISDLHIGDPAQPSPEHRFIEFWAMGAMWVPLAELRTWERYTDE